MTPEAAAALAVMQERQLWAPLQNARRIQEANDAITQTAQNYQDYYENELAKTRSYLGSEIEQKNEEIRRLAAADKANILRLQAAEADAKEKARLLEIKSREAKANNDVAKIYEDLADSHLTSIRKKTTEIEQLKTEIQKKDIISQQIKTELQKKNTDVQQLKTEVKRNKMSSYAYQIERDAVIEAVVNTVNPELHEALVKNAALIAEHNIGEQMNPSAINSGLSLHGRYFETNDDFLRMHRTPNQLRESGENETADYFDHLVDEFNGVENPPR